MVKGCCSQPQHGLWILTFGHAIAWQGVQCMSIERAEADLQKVGTEMQRLRSQLEAAGMRALKLQNYIEMAKAYEAPVDSEESNRPRASGGSPLVPICIEVIRERGKRQPTRYLVEELERRGHHIGGSNKITNLSGALSRAPELSASRLEGWGLKEWGNVTMEDISEHTKSLSISDATGQIDEMESNNSPF